MASTVRASDPAPLSDQKHTITRDDSGIDEFEVTSENDDSKGRKEEEEGKASNGLEEEDVTPNGPEENELTDHPSELHERSDPGYFSKDGDTMRPSISANLLKAFQEDTEFHGFITVKYSCPSGGPLPPPDGTHHGDTSQGRRVAADSDTPPASPDVEQKDAILLLENLTAPADDISIVEMTTRTAADGGAVGILHKCQRVRYYTTIKQKGPLGEREANVVLQINPLLPNAARLAVATRESEGKASLVLCDGAGPPHHHSNHLVSNGNNFVGVNKKKSKLELLPIDEDPPDKNMYLLRVTVNTCVLRCSSEHNIAIYWSDNTSSRSGGAVSKPAHNFYLVPVPEGSVKIEQGPTDEKTISLYRKWRDRLL